ncbi:PREDICTED: uncharacterized protein LOC109475665 [Branchiostoma belcheri]|uniref:Uncharacterized protein LOC109475665 n=1 Tax=Branchiostoma belcheri TaxID=7741 RepID=A0A6P4ZQR5_BRABE|nr:PREDICTED: uncharacterized protein LOC109475665 [Branchiostoma belcheri]
MAPKRTWTVVICVLLLTLSPLGTSKPLWCVEPYVIMHSFGLPDVVEPDNTGHDCPPLYSLFGNDCFRFVTPGSYHNHVEVPFASAKADCESVNATAVELVDLLYPNAQKVTQIALHKYEGRRELIMDDNSCVTRAYNQESGQWILCSGICQKNINKVYICTCPALIVT